MIILTVGKSYIEIDGYASCIAYRELLKMQGVEAKFVTNATFNYSVTKSLLNLSYTKDNYVTDSKDQYIILDFSNKEFLPDFVQEENIIELIDHHPGFEEYWDVKLDKKAVIEKIGSVATIIVERYEQCNLIDKMDKDIAKLLMAAILDNTLNFTANITTDRDKEAYKRLQIVTGELNFDEIYFNECQNNIENNLEESVINDLKYQKTNNYLPEIIGQLTVWNIERLRENLGIIKQIMNNKGSKWIINIISLKENMSYIFYSNNEIKNNLIKLFDCNSNCDFVILKPAKLRKEIMGAALSKKD